MKTFKVASHQWHCDVMLDSERLNALFGDILLSIGPDWFYCVVCENSRIVAFSFHGYTFKDSAVYYG